MKFRALSITVCCIGLPLAEYRVAFTEARSVGENGRSYLFIDLEDEKAKESLLEDLKLAVPDRLYAQRLPDKSSEIKGPLLVVHNDRFMMKEKARADLGMGAGMCLGACLFVMVAGKEVNPNEPPSSGVFAQVGTRRVEGPIACLPGILGCVGALSLAKGFIELFLPPASAYGENQVIQSTDEIIADEGMKVKDKREMVFNEISDLRKYVLLYAESTL